MSTPITIRPERVSDYPAIAGLTYDAFVGWRSAPYKAEPLMVDTLRHNALFDPELSLVAEHDGRIVGHALFSPFEFVVLGTRQMGVLLAPICVDPAYQRSGIGGMLIAKGHAVARDKGCAFSLLCGHPTYYPRFGYRQRMFSLSSATVALAPGAHRTDGLAERPVLKADVGWVVDAWWRHHGRDDLAIFPGADISQWFNHAAGHRSSVITRGGEAVAYVRYRLARPIEVKELLVRDVGAGEVLAFLLGAHGDAGAGEIAVAATRDALGVLLAPGDGAVVTADQATSDALMLCVLDAGNRVVAAYCDDVAEGRREPGLMVFPPLLDIDA